MKMYSVTADIYQRTTWHVYAEDSLDAVAKALSEGTVVKTVVSNADFFAINPVEGVNDGQNTDHGSLNPEETTPDTE